MHKDGEGCDPEAVTLFLSLAGSLAVFSCLFRGPFCSLPCRNSGQPLSRSTARRFNNKKWFFFPLLKCEVRVPYRAQAQLYHGSAVLQPDGFFFLETGHNQAIFCVLFCFVFPINVCCKDLSNGEKKIIKHLLSSILLGEGASYWGGYLGNEEQVPAFCPFGLKISRESFGYVFVTSSGRVGGAHTRLRKALHSFFALSVRSMQRFLTGF